MMQQWIAFGVFAAIAALALLAAAFAGAGRFGEMPDAVTDHFLPELPARPVGPEDLAKARFASALRGYSPSQVDRLLARAAQQWEADRADPVLQARRRALLDADAPFGAPPPPPGPDAVAASTQPWTPASGSSTTQP